MSSHFHHCPECYTSYSCEMNCTIEQDLKDDDKEFGAHYPCPECQGLTDKNINMSEFNSQWFDRYNGFVR